MRCKGCDYPLWDIAARACPECGLPFRPSEYEFSINSVRFCCPHCHQTYYGTGERGHLVPPRFHCVSCARLIDLDEMIVLPRDGVPENISIPDRMPWLERHRIGFWKALGGTWVRALGAPSRLADSIPKSSDGSGRPAMTPAVAYGLLFTIAYMLLGTTLLFVPGSLGAAAGTGSKGLGVTLAMAVSIVIVIVSCIVLFFVWALIAHATLRLSGRTPAGIAGTIAALGYSSSVNFMSAVPCMSFFTVPVGMCWWAVVASLMAMRIQRATAFRAFGAFIVVPLMTVAMLGGGLTFLIISSIPRIPPTPAPGPIAGAALPPAPMAPKTLLALADRVAGACASYQAREGSWPRTSLDLIRGGDIDATHLIYSGNPSTARAGLMTLDELSLLLSDQLRNLADGAANELDHPSGICRGGQVVLFTKGLTGAPDLSGIWIAAAMSPATNGIADVVMVNADATISPQDYTQDTIDAQNAIRRERGLPELPPLDEWP